MIRRTPAPSRPSSASTAARPSPPAAKPGAKPGTTASAGTAAAGATDEARALFGDGFEAAVREKKPGLFSTSDTGLAALARRFAAHYPARDVVPVAGDRGTVGSFNDAQLKVLHGLFWSAPPGAEMQDIAALAKKDPAFRGRKEPITDDQLKLVTKYRPDSFPFSWAERKRAFCSFVVVEAFTSTPKDVSAMSVLGVLRQTFAGFLSEPVIGRLARGEWVESPSVYPFAERLPKSGSGGGYAVACTGEVVGLPRFGGKLKLSRELADVVKTLQDDPRVRYDSEFSDVLKLLSSDLGEPFGDQQWRKLREQFKDVPDWFAVHGAARARFAALVNDLHTQRGLGPDGILDALHQEHGYPRYENSRIAVWRKEFPEIIPAFRTSARDQLFADADTFKAAVKSDPTTPYDVVGARLGFDEDRVKGLLRVIRLQDPAALPMRKAPNKPYTDAERKQLAAAVASIPVGGGARDVWAALEAQAPAFLRAHPLYGPKGLGAVIKRELGIDWQAHQDARLTALVTEVLKESAPGVTVRELADHLRDEHGCRFGYEKLKVLLRDVENNPAGHPAFQALRTDGRYPWQLGGALTRELAVVVGDAMRAHPHKSLAEIAALARKAPGALAWPTFGKGHIYALREAFPDVVPYVDELRSPDGVRQARATAKDIARLAEKAEKAAKTMTAPTVTTVAAALSVKPAQLRYALATAPERFPWFRQRPTGNLDLALAWRVADVMERAPLDATLDTLVDELKRDDAFCDRYPSFSKMTFSALREAYPEVVPRLIDRDLMLRTSLIADALRHAKKGAAYADVLADLERQRPGTVTAQYRDEAYMRWFWNKDPTRFPMLDALRDERGALMLTGQGEPRPKSAATAATTELIASTASRAARLQRLPDALPLIDFLVDKCKDAPLDSGGRYEFVCVQHLLDSQVPVYDALKKMGMSPARTTLIGVPYSASDLVVQTLDDRGWDVRVPPLDMDVWQEEVRSVLHERLESALETNRTIVIMDDGGICSRLIATDPLLAKHAQRFKVVEQTRRGITVADEVDLKAPVVNVAQSQGKFAEGPLIASDVEAKTVERLKKIGVTSLKGKNVGVVGAGTIGMPIALHLKALGANVTILDPSDAARERARSEKLKVADVAGPGRAAFFSAQDIIIGATGNAGITADDIAVTKDGCVLGSASSKLVEIDVAALADQSRGPDGTPQMTIIDGDSHPPSVEYRLQDGTTRRLLARGYPVNFDGAQENIPFEHIQLTRALMVMGLMQAVGSKVAGVKRLDPKLQLEMLEHFKDLGALQTPEQLAVLDEAIAELRRAVKTPGAAYRRHAT